METTENQETILGRFRLVRKLGSGSSCEVFEAEDLAHAPRRVAIKTLRSNPSPAALQALRSEFSVLSRLHHPHLVEAIDLHVVAGTEPAFVTLELVDGQRFLAATDGMATGRALRLLCQVCAGLAYLHKHGFVHRDIKSDNILVERADGDPCVKIMDLSLAGADGQPLSARTGGTPLYLAPEVLAGQPGDRRGDLFSVGVMAYHMLAGSFPFPAPGPGPLEVVTSTPAHVPLHVVAPHLAPELCFIIERLLSLNPEHRFQSAGELEMALRPHAEPDQGNVTIVPPAARWPLVGRDKELSTVQTAVDRLAPINREGLNTVDRSFMVLGEAGTGKSRFLREVSRTCQLAGVPAFMADAAHLSGEPFGPILHFLKQIAGWLEALARGDAGCRALLARSTRLLDGLASTEDSANTILEAECDTWVQDQVVQLLSALSHFHPFGVVMDNVQDIDIASRRCLLALLQDGSRTRFLTILATRPEPVQSAGMLTACCPERAQSIELGPLSGDAMESLIGELFPFSVAHPQVATQFIRLTGGQPVFLDLVIQALRADGMLEMRQGEPAIDPDCLDGLAVPESIQTWVSDWLERCPATELRVLEALAVTGQPTTPAVICHLLDEEHPISSVEAGVEALLARGALYRDTGVASGTVSTSHELVGEAVYHRMDAGRREQLHGRCVELLLRDRSGDASIRPALLTRHLLAAGRQEEAAEWATQAAEEATRSLAFDEAERLFRIGLNGAGHDAPRSRLRALSGLAATLRARSRYDESGALYQTLVKEATETSDGGFLVRGLAGLASNYLSRSEYRQAEELSQRALRIAREIGDPKAEERALRAVADTFHYQSKLTEAKEAYAQRVELWQRVPDDRQGATAWYGLGWVCNSMRDFAEAAICIEKSAEIRRRLGDPDQLALTLSALGANELDRGDFPAAVHRLEDALIHARIGRSRNTEGHCLSNLGEARFRLGQFHLALDAHRDALRLVSTLRNVRHVSPIHLHTGLVLTARGEFTLAEKHLSEAREGYLELEDQPGLARCLAAQGNIHRLLGDTTAARFWCERGLEIARKAKDDQVTAVCLTHVALAYFEEERGQQAIEHLIEARSVARQTGATDTAHLADLALLRVLVMTGRAAEMAGLAEQLMDRAEKMQLAADIPHLLLLSALQHATSGDFERAARVADEGLSRAATSSAADIHWELRRVRLLLLEDPESADARRLANEADAWVAACSATLTDENRTKAFQRRLRHQHELFAEMAQRPQVSNQTSKSATPCLSGASELDSPCPPTNRSGAVGRKGYDDLRTGNHLLSRYLPELAQQRQLRSALNLFVDRAIQMTRSDRGGLFLQLASETSADVEGPAGVPPVVSPSPDPSAATPSSSHDDLVPLVLRDLERESLADAREMSRCILDAALTSEQAVAKADMMHDPAWSSHLTLRVREIPAVLAIPLFRAAAAAATPAASSTAVAEGPDDRTARTLGVLYLDRNARHGGYDGADRRLGKRIATTLVQILDPILSATPDTSVLDDLAALTERLPLEVLTAAPTTASDDIGTRIGDVVLVGSGRLMERVFDLTRRLATSRTPVLVTGETGTGKELIARALHESSPRCDEPFVALDCGALPESMAEAELFGHARGAFSGADTDRLGLLRAAGKGTLFLDEIGNLALPLQLKLLRALETSEVRPVGADRSFTAPFRLIAATNIDLDAAVRQGTFRPDLLHRLKGGHIELPPLRQHMHDLETLTGYLLGKVCEETGRTPPHLSPALWERLHRHDWPGNVRELRMTLQTALAMNSGEALGVEDIPSIARLASRARPVEARRPGPTSRVETPPLTVAGVNLPTALEGKMILRTLIQHEWDKSATARQIGWSRQKLYRVMKRCDIPNRVTDEQVRALVACIPALSDDLDAPPISRR